MSSFLPESIQKVIDEFSRLPGIGPKSAQRLAMHLLHSPEMRINSLAGAVTDVKKGLSFCVECFNIAEADKCKICEDSSRSHQQICVVEDILDVIALEKTRQYKGLYHVLHGVLSPVDGIGPDQLKVDELKRRVENLLATGVIPTEVEIIVATNPSLEGETTAMYITRLLKSMGVKVTRIARGLPAGGDLDYADEVTLTRALQGRLEYI
ncbi:recombination protein RecR [Candidatus Peregrinibacteria bacterium]|nr:recombination protein RecR [Candidatus Peregrinibacteria bacterium]